MLTCDEAPPHPVDGRIHMADSDHFALLVVPPDTTADAAREAMARAVRADNITEAAQILIATTPKPEEDQVVTGEFAEGRMARPAGHCIRPGRRTPRPRHSQ